MTDQLDFYDCVNARNYGSLGNDDGITETMCDAFFNTHRDASEYTLAPQDTTLASNQNDLPDSGPSQPSQGTNVQENRVENPQENEVSNGPVVAQENEGQSQQEIREVVQDENKPEISAVSKAAENLEDLGRLAMFGKQRTVLRRSQVRGPPGRAPSPAPNVSAASAAQRSTPRVIPNRATTPTPTGHARPAKLQSDAKNAKMSGSIKPCPVRVTPQQPRTAERGPLRAPSPSVGKRSPIVKAVRTPRPAVQSPLGPITRARSKELNSKTAQENTANVGVATRTTENIENRFRQLRLGTERISRNREPRTTTSSRPTGVARSNYPVRIGHDRPQRGDSFLRSDAVPSAREFHQELLHRKASLGSSHRSSSTPKDAQKQATAGAATASTGPSANKAAPSRLPVARSSSLTRPPCEMAKRPLPRAASATRAPVIPRPLTGADRSMARSASITRPTAPTARPPSVTRPQIPNPALQRRGAPPISGLTRSARAPISRGPVAIATSARTTATMRATPPQTKPTQPRTSVIRNPPSQRGPGDGTPVRGFLSELRRYPAPTGSPLSTVAASPAKVLSKQEVRAMVDRLSMPKKAVAGETPARSKIANQKTHGLSCVKIRSRSTSMARRPLSAQEVGAPTCSRALFAESDIARPASVDDTGEVAASKEASGVSETRA